ncbi:MAG TPA: hypothetical protein GX390_04100 [Acholeplasmataceae bacterium]|jgi:energy-coupling factor transport system substrate-specific component|nr:hypothetical protein [Acholeplasmataceae bacterium]
MKGRILKQIIAIFAAVSVLVLGFIAFQSETYYLLFFIGALLLCFPFVYRYEKRTIDVAEVVAMAFFTALTVVGRLVFATLPGTPVTAMLVFAACFFGRENGFMLGVLTALISNLFLSHGPWTAYQMAAWGIIGYLSGFFRSLLFPKNPLGINTCSQSWRNIAIFSVWGAFCGVMYSLILDLSTVFFVYRKFTVGYYLTVIASSLPVTIEYIVTNVIFIIIFYHPFLYVFRRLMQKRGL